MASGFKKGAGSWVVAAAVGAMTGLAVLFAVVLIGPRKTVAPDKGANPGPAFDPDAGWAAPDTVAMQYAVAYQDGNSEEVIGVTQWMHERLQRVRMESADPQAEVEEKEKLAERIRERTVEGNLLLPEGIEDAYVFPPGATLEPVAVDEGSDDLEMPVKQRTWIRVTYPTRARALRDENGIPIRAITVGINVSAGGRVLKAGVIGNLEILWDSISYDWEESEQR